MAFSKETCEKLGYYVYRLVDPRNGQTIYVGKGCGNRVFAHTKEAQNLLEAQNNGTISKKEIEEVQSLKLRIIQDILNENLDVICIIHRHGLDEETALHVEAALIDAYLPAGNIQLGYNNSLGCANCEQLENRYGSRPEADLGNDSVLFINVRNSYPSEEPSIYEAVRQSWRLNIENARGVDYVLAVKEGIILGVFKAKKWFDSEELPGRIGFEGDEVKDESITSRYVGRRIPDRYVLQQGAQTPCWYSQNM